MVKIETDLTNQIESAVEKEVKSQMENGGLLRFIRDIVATHLKNINAKTQLLRHETEIMQIKKKIGKALR